MTFGKELQRFRKNSGLTQKEVSKHFGWTSAQYVSNFERDIAPCPVSTLKELCKLYEVEEKKMKSIWIKHQKLRWQV